MPAFKPTTINASFLEAGDNDRVENVSADGTPKSRTGAKRFLPKRQKSHAGPVLRDLREEGEPASADEATPPSTQPSTRRSSLTAVGDTPAVHRFL